MSNNRQIPLEEKQNKKLFNNINCVYEKSINFENNYISPFVKWVGGKRKVIEKYLYQYLPDNFNNYIEPFVGGGAMLCFLTPKKAIINDCNSELMITYKQIKKDLNNLIKNLHKYELSNNKKFYYEIRKQQFTNNNDIATRFIYLNKACYNGMYRVNTKNEFNVPYNNKTNLKLFNKSNLEHWNQYLNDNDITILNDDYLNVLELAKPNDFVFCDPPYDYEKNTNGFVEYSKNKFNQQNQIDLCNKLIELDKRNVKWMLTNHNTKLINKLYKNFYIKPIVTNRMINSKSSKRVNTGNEVVITNYEIA